MVCWRGCELSEKSELSLFRASGLSFEGECHVGKYLKLARKAVSRRGDSAPVRSDESVQPVDLHAAVDAAVERINQVCPADWSPTTQDWQELDRIEQSVNLALESRNETELRVLLDNYEAEAHRLFQCRRLKTT